jgi:hypothetical protein
MLKKSLIVTLLSFVVSTAYANVGMVETQLRAIP